MPPIKPKLRYNHHNLLAEKLARDTPSPYSIPPVKATTRGPTRFSHRPPKNAAMPSTKMLIVNVNVTSDVLQPNCLVSGTRNTLQAYTAPSATCINTPAAAMIHRLRVRIDSPLFKVTLPDRLVAGVATKPS